MRNRISLFVVALTIGVAALGTTASAQYEPLGQGMEVRAGVFFPTDSAARDFESDTWFTVGVLKEVYALPAMAETGTYRAALALSVDWFGAGDLYSIPVLVNYVGHMERFSYYAGVGVAFNKVFEEFDTNGGSGPSGGEFSTETKTEFAWTVGVNVDLAQGTTPIFVGAKYNAGSSSELHGFSVYGGVRF